MLISILRPLDYMCRRYQGLQMFLTFERTFSRLVALLIGELQKCNMTCVIWSLGIGWWVGWWWFWLEWWVLEMATGICLKDWEDWETLVEWLIRLELTVVEGDNDCCRKVCLRCSDKRTWHMKRLRLETWDETVSGKKNLKYPWTAGPLHFMD